jgi:predicted phosphoadenosine phosphosulfate sulfurtransferase
MAKRGLGIDVLLAAQRRIATILDDFGYVYVSFSGGKDSTVMMHLVAEEARRRKSRVGVLFVDLEAQYDLTIQHVQEMLALYDDVIDPYWVTVPLNLRNAVSQFQPHWVCWDPTCEDSWVRSKPPESMNAEAFNFYRHAMEFEDFVPSFGKWVAADRLTACMVGIRCDESLNRYRTIASDRKQTYMNAQWTTWCGGPLYNVYPLYDWRTEDIWRFHAKTGLPYNRLYDRMYQAGLTVHQMRICQPYGDDQRKGLWLFRAIEPETWGKVVARVNGANSGALYAQTSGNILGNLKIAKPEGHTWQSFAELILGTLPARTKEHYEDKIAVFLKWYADRGYSSGIPDEGPMDKKHPSWKRICKALLRNDYWCKGLSFSQHKSGAYDKWRKNMKKRRAQWGLI